MSFAKWLQPGFTPNSARKQHQHSKLAAVLVAALLLGYGPSSLAQSDADTIAELRAQISALTNRLDQLEQQGSRVTSSAPAAAPAQASSWTDRIRITGDLRPRYEYINDDAKASDRNRNRVRARAEIQADLGDGWGGGLGLASGSDDPISTNQTLGNGGSTKDLRLDLAYVTYKGFDNTTLTAGKYKNAFVRPGGQSLVYDGDYRPEGVALNYEHDNLFFNAGTMILESDDKHDAQDKASLWGVQLGYETSLDDIGVSFGTSYYNASVAGSKPFYDNDPFGNSLDALGRYVHDYEELEFFAEASTTAGGKPLEFYADYITNLDADDFDTGWALGVSYGSARGLGNWEVGYGYQVLEADAVLGTLTDSDFGGGGTDTEGHILSAAYGIGNNTRVGFTYFINQYGEARLGRKEDYNRLQMDIVFGF